MKCLSTVLDRYVVIPLIKLLFNMCVLFDSGQEIWEKSVIQLFLYRVSCDIYCSYQILKLKYLYIPLNITILSLSRLKVG